MTQGKSKLYPSRPDYWLLVVTFGLILIGLISVYSAGMAYDPDNPTYLFFKQLQWVGVGCLALIFTARFDYRRYQLYAVPMMVISIVLLLIVLLLGNNVFGSRRWIFNGSVQPSELVKITLIIYVSFWLSTKGDEVRKVTYGLLPFSMMVGAVTALVIAQPDFSTAVLMATVSLGLFFVAGAEIWQISVTTLTGVVLAILLVIVAPYRMARITAFSDALRNPLNAVYHVRQTVIALGSGGLVGRGLGSGVLKFGHLPALHTDSIFAMIGEELGFIGCIVIIVMFLLLAWRGYRISVQAEDKYGFFLASGLIGIIILQAIINVAVATATIPFTGLPLPFISFGGSSMVVSMASIGILFNISGHREEA